MYHGFLKTIKLLNEQQISILESSLIDHVTQKTEVMMKIQHCHQRYKLYYSYSYFKCDHILKSTVFLIK